LGQELAGRRRKLKGDPICAVEEPLTDDKQIRQRPQDAAPHHDGVEHHPHFLPHPPAFGYDIEATQQALEDLGVDGVRGTLEPVQISR
jgi:hypothetical protein